MTLRRVYNNFNVIVFYIMITSVSKERFKPDELTSDNKIVVENASSVPSINTRHLHSLLEASYKNNEDAGLIGRQNGFLLDEELSNRKHKVFRDKHDSTIIAFTGTRTLGDWVTDGALAVGLADATYRFADSTRLVHKVKEKYNKSPLLVVGHSLGGTLAEHVNKTGLVDKAITINKGVGLFGIGKRLQPNQIDIHSNTDFVSLLSNSQSGSKHLNNPGTIIFDPLYSHSYSHLKKFGKDQRF